MQDDARDPIDPVVNLEGQNLFYKWVLTSSAYQLFIEQII